MSPCCGQRIQFGHILSRVDAKFNEGFSGGTDKMLHQLFPRVEYGLVLVPPHLRRRGVVVSLLEVYSLNILNGVASCNYSETPASFVPQLPEQRRQMRMFQERLLQCFWSEASPIPCSAWQS